jgi:hypothetical protein
MAQLNQYYNVLWSKIKPSVDIQNLGSMNIPLRGSTLFGPQIRHTNYTSFLHQQNPKLADQFKKMNT